MTIEKIGEMVKTCFMMMKMKFSRGEDLLRAWVNAQN